MQELRVDEGEAGELGLVNIGDDQLVGRRELRLSAGEELVEVLGSFAALGERKREKDRNWGRFRQEVAKQCKVVQAGGRWRTEEHSVTSLTSWEASASIPKPPNIVTDVEGIVCLK